jgi:hypothetical protein
LLARDGHERRRRAEEMVDGILFVRVEGMKQWMGEKEAVCLRRAKRVDKSASRSHDGDSPLL